MADGGERVGRLMVSVTADEQRLFDAVRERLGAGGRVGTFPRTVLMRVALYSAAHGVGVVEALDALVGVRGNAA